jgi:hypothetical protein
MYPSLKSIASKAGSPASTPLPVPGSTIPEIWCFFLLSEKMIRGASHQVKWDLFKWQPFSFSGFYLKVWCDAPTQALITKRGPRAAFRAIYDT